MLYEKLFVYCFFFFFFIFLRYCFAHRTVVPFAFSLQLVLDCINLHDFRAITRNLAKFGLGWLSIIFDLIFLFQHYFLYNHRDNNDSSLDGDVTQGNQTEPLLPPAESDIADESMENASDQGEEESTFTAPQPEMIFV